MPVNHDRSYSVGVRKRTLESKLPGAPSKARSTGSRSPARFIALTGELRRVAGKYNIVIGLPTCTHGGTPYSERSGI